MLETRISRDGEEEKEVLRMKNEEEKQSNVRGIFRPVSEFSCFLERDRDSPPLSPPVSVAIALGQHFRRSLGDGLFKWIQLLVRATTRRVHVFARAWKMGDRALLKNKRLDSVRC